MATMLPYIPSPGSGSHTTVTVESQRKTAGDALVAAKTFGHIPSVPIGTHCPDRASLHHLLVHRGLQTAIFGDMNGAYSIVIHGKFRADKDHGGSFTFRGSVTGSAALDMSFDTGYPVRVVRGYDGTWPGAPPCGYRYDGLYTVDLCWKEQGATGRVVSLFHFTRNPNQAPIDDSYSKRVINGSTVQDQAITTEEESEEEIKKATKKEIEGKEGVSGVMKSKDDIHSQDEVDDDETILDEDEVLDDDDATIPDENDNDYEEELFYGDA